jgi:protein arginine kinase
MLKNLVKGNNSPWTIGNGDDKDVVLCTRIRLARNFEKYPFPLKQTEETGQAVLANMAAFCKDHSNLKFYDLQNISKIDKQALVEKHLISPEHSKDDHQCRGLAISEDGSISIMINEEDHLRMQCFAPGLNLQELWQKANVLDDRIESYFDYAFDEKLGYLTCCPTNLGNGMRASIMMHLPGLVLTKRVSILNQLGNFGMTVRGIFGEGSQSLGDVYQISNQSTLGESEKEIIANLGRVIDQVIEHEEATRQMMLEKNRSKLMDIVGRSYGMLRYGYLLSSKEAFNSFSGLRLGVDMNLFSTLDIKTVNELFVAVCSGHLQKKARRQLNERERDELRSEIVREKLKQSSAL